MVPIDKAIEYQTVLMNVINRIKYLQKLGIKIEKAEKVIEIDRELKKQIAEFKKKNPTGENNVFFSNLYDGPIKELSSILGELMDNDDEYCVINNKTEYLKARLEDTYNIDINFLTKYAKQLLDILLYSSTVDFDEERDIVEAVYEVVYNVMKLEAIYNNGESSLFYIVQSNSTHSAFIANLLKEEISNSNDKEVKLKFLELSTNGIDDEVLIDKNLFKLLAISTDNTYFNNLRDRMREKLVEYQNKIEEIGKQVNVIKDDVKKYNTSSDNKKDYGNDILKRASFLTGGLVLAGFISFNAFKVKSLLNRQYSAVPFTYNTETKEFDFDEEIFKKKEPNDVKVTKENLWKERGIFKKYYEKTYDIYYTSIKDEKFDPQHYIDEMEDTSRTTHESITSDEKPLEFGNEEVEYVISSYNYGEDYINGPIYSSLIIAITALIIVLAIDISVFKKVFDEDSDDIYNLLNDYLKESSNKRTNEKDMIKDVNELNKLVKAGNKMLKAIKNDPSHVLIADEIEKMLNGLTPTEEMREITQSNPKLKKVLQLKSM